MKLISLIAMSALAVALAECNAQAAGELSRKAAGDALASALQSKSITHLGLSKEGIERGISAGILQKNVLFDMVMGYSLTPEGLKAVHSITKPDYPFSGSQEPAFVLKSPINEKLVEVTGITAGPVPGVMLVEYNTNYVLTPELEVIRPYIFTGRKGQAAFRKYDDGWRVVEI